MSSTQMLKTAVVGVTFNNRQDVINQAIKVLNSGNSVRISLKHDKENKSSTNAIAVMISDDHAGYIPNAIASYLINYIKSAVVSSFKIYQITKNDSYIYTLQLLITYIKEY